MLVPCMPSGAHGSEAAGPDDVVDLVGAGQLDEEGSVGPPFAAAVGNFDRESRLAHAAGADDRDEPVRVEETRVPGRRTCPTNDDSGVGSVDTGGGAARSRCASSLTICVASSRSGADG